MSETINGWETVDVAVAPLAVGVNVGVPCGRYVAIVPAANGDSIASFAEPPDTGSFWLMEVANADPTLAMTIALTVGTVGQSPPQILFPGAYTRTVLAPGLTQRLVYDPGGGWSVLLPGTPS
jgi:hypothetical protein